MVVSVLPVRAPSFAVSRSTYVPGALKVTSERTALPGANAATPGPLTFDHWTESVLLDGRPSSVTEPESLAAFGTVTVCARATVTTGALFGGEGATTLTSA